MENMLTDCKIVQVQNGSAAAQTAVDSSIIDASGCDGVMFLASLGTVTAGSVLGLQVQNNTLNQTGGMASVGTAAAYTDVAGEASNKLLIADVVNSQKRFLRAHLTRTTANAVVNCIIAILYRGKNKPSVADATVIASALSNATS